MVRVCNLGTSVGIFVFETSVCKHLLLFDCNLGTSVGIFVFETSV